MSVDEIRQKAGKFQKQILWRNVREYVAGLVVVVFFGFQFWLMPDALTRVGFGLAIAGVLYVIWELHKRGSSQSLPAEMGLASCMEFHRNELVRQRDLVGSVWRWYLGPLMPGLVVLMVAFARTNPRHLRHFGWFLTVVSVVDALVFIIVWKLNERTAHSLQRRIDELNALDRPC